MSVEQLAVLGVLLVPVIGAVVVWILGPGRAPAVRSVSVTTSLITLVLALLLAVQFSRLDRTEANASATFVPAFVPGSTPETPHETTWKVLPVGNAFVSFFLGI